MKKGIFTAFFAVFVLAIGCSSSPDSGFTIKESIAVAMANNITNVLVADVSMLCNVVMSSAHPSGKTNEIRFVIPNAAPGMYTMTTVGGTPPAGMGQAQYSGYSDCKTKGGGFATGTLTLTSVTPNFAGTFDLQFASGFIRTDGTYGMGSMKGSFNAPVCPANGLPMATICN